MQVTFEDCKRDLIAQGTPLAQQRYERWRTGYGAPVVAFVEGFVHKRLYAVDMAEIERVKCQTVHALGNVQAIEAIKEIENFSTPFALQHLFHECLELNGLPTFQQFSDWMRKDRPERWFAQVHAFAREAEVLGDYSPQAIGRAIHWRVGKFYYSALREVEVMARLRCDYNLPVKYHLLADALLKVDFWRGKNLASIYFPNTAYRDGAEGRKAPAADFFPTPPFIVHDILIDSQGAGKAWGVSPAAVERVASVFRAGKEATP